MKRSEELNLTNQIDAINAYAKRHQDIESFYSRINSLPPVSIQDLSFENDISFFKELSFVLSVILSIISKPHLNNKRDEIIARSGEVSSISEEDFQKTLRDSSIWRDQGNGRLLPEYLYYHQYEDEIKIYENIFIVHLINEISMIADHYSALYVSLLNTASLNNNQLLLDDSYQSKAMDEINLIARRINQIKETYFYKEVSRAKNKPKVFYPTNILLKDRLYNICFKFYKELYIYGEKGELNSQLFTFYFTLILKVLHSQKYELDTRSKGVMYDKELIIPERIILTSSDVRILLETNKENSCIKLSFKDKLDDSISSHLLYIDSDPTFSDVNPIDVSEDIFSVEYLSLWHLGELRKDGIHLINQNLKSEEEMVESFINNHHYVVSASEKIYSSYCPACKNKNLNENLGYFHCPDCGAIYKFLKGKQDKSMNKIVFARLRNYD